MPPVLIAVGAVGAAGRDRLRQLRRAAANLCDEPVAALAGSSEPRYTCNGVVDLATRRTDALSALLSSCAGSLIWTGGRWRLLPGAWRPATAALSEAELRAPVTVRPHRSWRELANTCRGTFSSPAHQWQPTDYPPVQVPAYLALDGGEEVTLTLDLPFTTSHTMAQRIGRIALHQLRHALTVDYPANLAGLRLTAGDTVALSLSRCGLDQVPMAVRSWTLSAEGGVDLALGRDDAAVYAHDPALLQALA